MIYDCPFLSWTYPKNVKLVKSQFKICLRYLQSDDLWYWPKKIHALKEKKIVWPADLDNHYTEILAISVDGVNFRSWEKKHPTLNKDPEFFDHKHNSCGFKYEIWDHDIPAYDCLVEGANQVW